MGSFVLTFEERQKRLEDTVIERPQNDGQIFHQKVPAEYEYVMDSRTIPEIRADVMHLMLDFIHRSIDEKRNTDAIRKATILFVCGRLP